MTPSIIKRSTDRGFTLSEVLVYAVGLVIILGGIVAFIFYLFEWYRAATVPTRTDQIALSTLNRLGSDVRAGTVINDVGSIYDSASGAISITSIVGTFSTTTRYYIDYGRVKYQLNGGTAVPLTPSDVWVSGFYVKKLTTTVSEAVRLQLDVEYLTRSGTSTNSYPLLVILRQSYE